MRDRAGVVCDRARGRAMLDLRLRLSSDFLVFMIATSRKIVVLFKPRSNDAGTFSIFEYVDSSKSN